MNQAVHYSLWIEHTFTLIHIILSLKDQFNSEWSLSYLNVPLCSENKEAEQLRICHIARSCENDLSKKKDSIYFQMESKK